MKLSLEQIEECRQIAREEIQIQLPRRLGPSAAGAMLGAATLGGGPIPKGWLRQGSEDFERARNEALNNIYRQEEECPESESIAVPNAIKEKIIRSLLQDRPYKVADLEKAELHFKDLVNLYGFDTLYAGIERLKERDGDFRRLYLAKDAELEKSIRARLEDEVRRDIAAQIAEEDKVESDDPLLARLGETLRAARPIQLEDMRAAIEALVSMFDLMNEPPEE